MFRPATHSAPTLENTTKAGPVAGAQSGGEVSTEGPWIASCNYWAPVRKAEVQKKPDSVEGTLKLKGPGLEVESRLAADGKQESGCSGGPDERWGFPKDGAPMPDVTAIIATVPDPVHTHLAMQFDRAVDGILQAAADSDYLSSYYWLPWRSSADGSGTADASGRGAPGHDPERERQPGLIILKHAPTNFYKAIYLFLVAESPTQGIDGAQFQNAILYEQDLANLESKGRIHFARGMNGKAAIVGPNFSGSAASLLAAIEKTRTEYPERPDFEVAGVIATKADELGQDLRRRGNSYVNFLDQRDFDTRKLIESLKASGYDTEKRFVLLSEDNTALGYNESTDKKSRVQVIRFPRDISLLRNAEIANGQSRGGATPSESIPSQYLPFSLKDSSVIDSIPQFSRESTPLSQEAQLMAIGRRIHRFRAQFIAIAGSNILDQVFLAQFLHRACPDARLLFFNADLLMVRELDSVPFIGSITITSNPLMGLGTTNRAFPMGASEALYNAASYTFWGRKVISRVDPDSPAGEACLARGDVVLKVKKAKGGTQIEYLRNGKPETAVIKVDDNKAELGMHFEPPLQTYGSLLQLTPASGSNSNGILQPNLWATALGTDGYYPLEILSPCSSDHSKVLQPAIDSSTGELVEQVCNASEIAKPPGSTLIYPGRMWDVLCALVSLLCLAHVLMLLTADYRSALTRDLAFEDNDQPERRSTYVRLAAAMLFSMAFVVSFPVIALRMKFNVNTVSFLGAILALLFGVIAIVFTIWKTQKCVRSVTARAVTSRTAEAQDRYGRFRAAGDWCFSWSGVAISIVLAVIWGYLCCSDSPDYFHSSHLVGSSFSYRAMNPRSGVSPVTPVLLLLLGWFFWGVLQTWRLRSSAAGRPCMPGSGPLQEAERPFYVADTELGSQRGAFLYPNITSFLITRELAHRWWRSVTGQDSGASEKPGRFLWLDLTLAVVCSLLLIWFFLIGPRSLDHFLWKTGMCPYEYLVGILFFPLLLMSLAGWLRMVLIWGSLKRGLLDRLENQPIRHAFGRFKPMPWTTLMLQGGQGEQLTDMARCVESMEQMLHQRDLMSRMRPEEWSKLKNANTDLWDAVKKAVDRFRPGSRDSEPVYALVKKIDCACAKYSEGLLSGVLIPYWKYERTGLVESEIPECLAEARLPQERGSRQLVSTKQQSAAEAEPILVAEEFVAIRYLSLIRAVLANMRCLMIFASVFFVLAMAAWNSYPFQPRQLFDWTFTALLLFLGLGVIWIFAQMHRDPILSRITGTAENELGWDFWFRILSFGVVPVATWLAYQFPEVGSAVYKFIEPGVSVVK
jgi:hypothetical protein